jgi:hypothetical protein
MKKRTLKASAFLAAAGLILAACGGSDSSSETSAPAGDGDAVCPTNLVIQTDWWPEIEHGGSYQLIGAAGTADAKLFTYSGPIAEKYKVAGIETVEIRAGGDAIEFQPVLSVMKTDTDITLGYVNTDDVIQSAGTVKGIGVATTLEINPQFLMWDPEQLDIDPKDPASLGASDARILHFPGTTYTDWLIGKGFINASQSDPNYGGSPDQWLANNGNFVQQGFVSNEKYKYENEIAWKDGKPAPLGFTLIHDLGWQPYPAMYTVLADRKEELSGCLKVLVPVLQQAWVDYLDAPEELSDVLVGITTTYNNYWKVTPELNTAGFKVFEDLGLGSNGPDSTYGNFDLDRVKKLYDEAMPLLEELGVESFDPTLKLEEVVTNEFIDTSIGR